MRQRWAVSCFAYNLNKKLDIRVGELIYDYHDAAKLSHSVRDQFVNLKAQHVSLKNQNVEEKTSSIIFSPQTIQ